MAPGGAGSRRLTARSFDSGNVPGVHEQTPLLGSNPVSANTSQSNGGPPPSGPPGDVEAQLDKPASNSPEDGPKSKTAANMASVIPVLLLGASA